MNVLVRHTIQSIKKSPLQTFFILIAMAIISASALIAFAIPAYFQQTSNLWKHKQFLNSDLYIEWAPLNVRQIMDEKLSEYDYDTIDIYTSVASLKTENNSFEVQFKLTDVEKFNRITGAEVLSSCPLSEGYLPIYISVDTMEDFGLSLGDTFSINTFYSLGTYEAGIKIGQIIGVCKCSMGYFSQNYNVFCDLGSEPVEIDYPSQHYLFLTDPDALMPNGKTQKQNLISAYDTLNESYPQISYALLQDSQFIFDYFNKSFDRSVNMVILASSILCIMMGFLLFFSYSVIAKSRGEEMVMFKAAGATPSQCTLIMLVEVFLYALIGCGIGLIFGWLVINYFASALDKATAGAVLRVEIWKYFAAIFSGIGISLLSCLFPALTVGKKSVRTLTGGELKITKYAPLWLIAVFTVAVIAAFVQMFFVSNTAKFYVLIAFVGIASVWTLTAVPWFFKFMCKINGKIRRKKEGAIASMGLFNNGAVPITTSLSAIVIGFVWLCFVLLSAVKSTSVNDNSRRDYDFAVISYNAAEVPLNEKLNDIRTLDGVEQAEYVTECAFFVGDENYDSLDEFGVTAYGVENSDALNMLVPNVDADMKNAFDNTERAIILTYDYAARCSLKVGDKCRLYCSINKDDKLEGEFTVIGIDYTLTTWNYTAVIKSSDAVLKSGQTVPFKSEIWIIGDESRFIELRETIDTYYTVIYPRDGVDRPQRLSANTYEILDLFVNIIYVVTALGLFNLIAVTAVNRKREIEIFRLIGMTKAGTFRMALTEAMLVAVSAFLFGFIMSVGITQLTAVVTLMMDMYIPPVYFDIKTLYIALIVSAGTFLVWVISPALALKRKNDARLNGLLR